MTCHVRSKTCTWPARRATGLGRNPGCHGSRRWLRNGSLLGLDQLSELRSPQILPAPVPTARKPPFSPGPKGPGAAGLGRRFPAHPKGLHELRALDREEERVRRSSAATQAHTQPLGARVHTPLPLPGRGPNAVVLHIISSPLLTGFYLLVIS